VLSDLQIPASDNPFGIFKLFLSFFFLVIMLSGLQITASDSPLRKLKVKKHNNQKKKEKKSLKMPNGLAEAVIGRPDNTITKRKRTRKV
jgi:hypothetical protein